MQQKQMQCWEVDEQRAYYIVNKIAKAFSQGKVAQDSCWLASRVRRNPTSQQGREIEAGIEREREREREHR